MNETTSTRRLVVGITGASGSIYGVRLLELLSERRDLELHLVVSGAGAATLRAETDLTVIDLAEHVTEVHGPNSIGASIASGSFRTDGMIVAPCSIKTLSAIANCYTGDLISRAADVHLKEGRPLVLMVRETPLHLGHLRVMEAAAAAGAVIAPPIPAFYHRPQSIEELVDHSVRRVLDRIGLEHSGTVEWKGLGGE